MCSRRCANFNSDNPDARQELDAANASAGPLAFQMEVACALYRGLATHWGDPSEAEAVKGLLDLYHDKTGAATWPGTARLYGMLLSETSYKYTLSAADAQALYEEWLTRDPRNAEALKNYVNWAMSAAALADYAQVLAKIDAFESSGGRMTPALELTRLKFRKVSQPYESVLDDALTWLQAHPAEPVRLVTDALTLARGELDAAHPDQVRRYYANLTGLALKQPSSDDRVPLTALILNEKRKLEAVMPEIKPE
jgi:hypothetical protein